MAKGRHGENFYKHGLFAGYLSYRYGEPRKPPKPSKIFRGEKRRHIVDSAMDALRDWRSSPFEHEASVIAGLRSALCLQGHGWHKADFEATAIVGESLRLLGAKRPSWEQGQPEYADALDLCTWCGVMLEDSAITGGRRHRYCSDVCAKSAFEKRDFERRNNEDKAYSAATRMIRRSRQPPRTCTECGGAFRPVRENSGQLFCSTFCAAKHRTRTRNEAFAATATAMECGECGTSFIPTTEQQAYCTKKCAKTAGNRAYNIRHGLITRISPPVFDYVFRIAA